MSTPTIFKQFNASTVPLVGSNLIEASAGTGKTYSIAILTLRLILEEKLAIKEILMVTFTKAAVAELEERIRLFIRSAYQVCKGENIEDNTITSLVNFSIDRDGRELIAQLLRDAVTYLDETAVLTIHSFCQQTLSEFAFETNQLFGAELLLDTSAIIENEVNKFWRKYATSIPLELLTPFAGRLTRHDINNIVRQHLDGKRYHEYDHAKEYVLEPVLYKEIIKETELLLEKYTAIQAELIQYVIDNNEALKIKCTSNPHARKGLLSLVDEPQKFLDAVIKKQASAYIEKLFGDILERLFDAEKIKTEIENHIQKCLNIIYYAAINEVSAGVKNYKLQNNQVSFDDLIANLHAALVKRDNPILVHALQQKYKAVFIDEFQDTDRLQYEIFKKAFSTNTILFYIGDPKQSIYAWRKADISTYFKAYEDADNIYGMNENYRSSEAYIQAMNVFFQPTENFDTFHYPPDTQSIIYIPVNSPKENTKGKLKIDGVDCVPISINNQPNKDAIAVAVTAQVIELLSNNKYQISKNNIDRAIRPSDIGILVRSNKEGNQIKRGLAGYGIPAVTIGDAKVLESEEATGVLYILEAMMDISRSNINRALLSSFTGYDTQKILLLNDEIAIELFKKYRINWDTDGVYNALMNFIADFGVQQILLQGNIKNGERAITNLYQLVELLYKIQTNKKLSSLELIDWLKRAIESNNAQGDEYEQRIENDEECVKIVTIHKSKGLEYNIVIAPYLDFGERKKDEFCNLRNESGEYINFKKSQATEAYLDLYKQQNEQENRRLLYVAITRTVYKCFIIKNDSNDGRNSTLAFFTNALQDADKLLIENINAPDVPENYYYRIKQSKNNTTVKQVVNFSLTQQNWQRTSYTGLAAEMDKNSKPNFGNYTNEYDDFIFSKLSKGSTTGNMLHDIFENIHFTNNDRWALVVQGAIKKFAPSNKDVYELMLEEMVSHVLKADINVADTTFNLEQVDYDKRIHEFEFDFPLGVFQPADLHGLSTENIQIKVKERYELEGIMNGKIDMLFEYQGKYFILDWKSTFLGDSLQQYAPAALSNAMNENNYHLQYLIYTLATKKYLESRLPNFDYEKDFGGVLYLFVRGMRAGSDNGIFYCKPSLEQVKAVENIILKEKSFSK